MEAVGSSTGVDGRGDGVGIVREGDTRSVGMVVEGNDALATPA
jgi:hypothetical protein